MEPSEQESIVEAIYPVGVAGGMRIIWFAWVSGDHDRVMSSNGRPVCDSSKEGLEGQVAARGRDLDWEGESVSIARRDLDRALVVLRDGRRMVQGIQLNIESPVPSPTVGRTHEIH